MVRWSGEVKWSGGQVEGQSGKVWLVRGKSGHGISQAKSGQVRSKVPRVERSGQVRSRGGEGSGVRGSGVRGSGGEERCQVKPSEVKSGDGTSHNGITA